MMTSFQDVFPGSASITPNLGTGTAPDDESDTEAVANPSKKHWTVTVHCPSYIEADGEDGYHWICGWIDEREGVLGDYSVVRYAVFGLEECPETKRWHGQGYVEFRRNHRLSGVKAVLDDDSVHLESRTGPRERARDYCKEDGDFREFGEWAGGKGARTDLVEVYKEMKAGASMAQLLEDHPATFMRTHRGIAVAKQLLGGHGPERPNVQVHVLWGDSGTGKTRRAVQMCKEAKVNGWWKRSNNKDWFTTYEGEQAVIFDDFVGDGIPFDKFLQYLDRYPCTVPVHGGVAAWCATFIVITSNKHPKQWYSLDDYNMGQLKRRLTSITEVKRAQAAPEPKWNDKPAVMDLS